MTSTDLKTQGNAAFSAKDYPKAIDLFTQAIESDDGNHVLYSNRSACYASLKNYKLALADAEKTTLLNPDWAKGYSRVGSALHGLDRFQEAVDAYKHGLSIEPENALLKKGLEDVEAALAFPKMDNPFAKIFGPDVLAKMAANPQLSPYLADAEVVQKIQMVQQNPMLANSMMQDPKMMQIIIGLLGLDTSKMGAEREGQDEDEHPYEPLMSEPVPVAEPEPVQVVELSEGEKKRNESDLEKGYGNQAYKKRSFEEALSHYSKAFEVDSTNVAVLTNRSAVLFEMEKYDDCIKVCNEAVELGRELFSDFKIIARAYSRMGNAYAKLDDYKNAVKYMEKSLSEQRTPEVLQRLREFEKLKKIQEQGIYRDPVLADEAREKGNALFKDHKYGDAVPFYTEAIKRNDTDPRNYSNRAACYMKLMALPEADKDCDAAIKIDPNFVKAYIRKAAIQFAKKDFTKSLEVSNQAKEIDVEKKHTAEIDGQIMRCYAGLNENQNGGDREETLKRAMEDPEVQQILADPVMRSILEQMQSDPMAARDHMKNPQVYKKLQVLMNAGVLQMR